MLRGTLIALVAAALAATLVCAALAWTGTASDGVVFGVWAAFQLTIVLAALIFERVRYKPLDPRAPAGFVATPERFIDPATGAPVEVWYNPATGERRYVAAAV